MEKLNVYCDMDGVVADFNAEPNGVERFKNEVGFFSNLKPIEVNVNAVKKLAQIENVFILTASPNKRADIEKIAWLKKHMPFIDNSKIIIMRNGQKKVDFMKTKSGVLFDDYGKNCREWETNKKNIAFKVEPNKSIADWLGFRD